LSVSLSPDGHWALSGSQDKTLRLWEATVLVADRLRLESPAQLSAVKNTKEAMESASRFEQLLAEAQVALQANLYTHARQVINQARLIPGYERHAQALQAWNALLRGCVQVDLRAAWCVRTFGGHAAPVLSVSLSADGRWVLSACYGALQLWEVATGRCVRTFEGHTGLVPSVSLSADGRWALSGGHDKTLRLWEVATGQCVRTFEGHTGKVCLASLSDDGRLALSGSEDSIRRLWEVATGRCVLTFEGKNANYPPSVSLSADSRWALLWWGVDKTLQLWEMATGRCVRTFEGHTGGVASVSLSADGRWALSGSYDKTLRLWEVATGRCVRTFEGHTGHGLAVSLSADGRWALSGSDDKTLRLWEVATGRCVCMFKGHTGLIRSVNLSADGCWALSGSEDNTLRLWEVATGRCVRTFEGHTGLVRSVNLSADGRWVLSKSDDKTFRLWELDWDFEVREPVDWDETARPHLISFLTLHKPYAAALPTDREPSEEEITMALTRKGIPKWNEDDFNQLLHSLMCAGYGWLRPEGVRRELEKMTANWNGPS